MSKENYNLGHTNLFLFMINRMDLDYKTAQTNQKAVVTKRDKLILEQQKTGKNLERKIQDCELEWNYWKGVSDQLTTSMNDLKTAQIAACGNANWNRTYASNSKVQVLETK